MCVVVFVLYLTCCDWHLQVKKLLSDGGGKQEHYMSEMITHAIADDPTEDDYNEAKELFELTTVTVCCPVTSQTIKPFIAIVFLYLTS